MPGGPLSDRIDTQPHHHILSGHGRRISRLADANRRRLLDALAAKDGQTTGEREKVLPPMPRFGVITHLEVLEELSLIVARRSGPFKFHDPNRIPLQEVAERWMSRFTRPWAEALVDLEHTLDGAPRMAHQRPKPVHVTCIRTTPELPWRALTDPQMTRRYYALGHEISAGLAGGGRSPYRDAQGKVSIAGEVPDYVPQKRLVHSFKGSWNDSMLGMRPRVSPTESKIWGSCASSPCFTMTSMAKPQPKCRSARAGRRSCPP